MILFQWVKKEQKKKENMYKNVFVQNIIVTVSLNIHVNQILSNIETDVGLKVHFFCWTVKLKFVSFWIQNNLHS